MTKQVIDIGTVVQNGRDGDNARTSFIKVNANFTELYDKAADVDSQLATKATKVELTSGLDAKVDKVAGKDLSTNDYTTVEKDKLAGIEPGAQVNSVTSVSGRTGDIVLTKADVGLGNVDNTSDANKPISAATQTALDLKASSTDPRLSDSREWSAETVSQAEAEAGIATTRKAWTSQRVRQAITSWWNSASTVFGRSLVTATDASAGRTLLGLGTAATRAALGTNGALYSRDSILGAVSQSGGTPIGAIIERASNANGEYVRFADGTQICWSESATLYTTSTAQGSLFFNNGEWFTYPAIFAEGTKIAVMSANRRVSQAIFGFTYLASQYGVAVGGYSGIDTASFYPAYIAIGRWF